MSDTYAARPDLGQELARAASVLRDVLGGAHWDIPGLRAEIHRAKHLAPPDQLAHAVIAWATTRLDLRAPIGLADDGPHWHTGRTPDARVTPAKCSEHEHHTIPCSECAAAKYQPTERPTLGLLSPAQVERNRAWIEHITAGAPKPTPRDAAMRAANDREDD